MKNHFFTFFILLTSLTSFGQVGNNTIRQKQLDEKYTTGLFSAPDGTYFDMENDPAATSAPAYVNVLNWLQGRVAGLQVYNFRGTPVPFIRNMPAAIYLDEIRIDPGFLNALPVTDIAFIKVIKSPYASFWGAPGGVIAIYTKMGETEEEK